MSPSSPLWKRPPQASADAIFAIAEDVVGPNGEVRLEAVTDATGIPRATVYYYFPGRDSFVEWLVDEELRRAVDDVRPMIDAPGVEDDARRVLRALFKRWSAKPSIASRLTGALGTAPGRDLVGLVAGGSRANDAVGIALIGAVIALAQSRPPRSLAVIDELSAVRA